MADRNELIASLEGRIWGGEMHKGGYIHVPQKEAEAILELLKKEQPRCMDCLHYHKGAHYEDGTEIQDNVGVCLLLERVLSGDADYCSYHTGVE